MMNISLKKLILLGAAISVVALPTMAQQTNPVPGPYQVMVVPVSPRAMTPQNLDPRNVFPTYAPALPYWMQAPQPQADQQQVRSQQVGQTPAPQQPQVRFLPPPNFSYQQGYGYVPNYGNNQNYRPNYGNSYGNNTWGMPMFSSSAPWGNYGSWTNFVPFSN